MRRIVILKSVSSTGKTSTLNALISKLFAKGALLIYPKEKSGNTSFIICGFEGHKIGIITFGDPTSDPDVQDCLKKCIEHQCDVIFAASRTRGNVYDILYNFAKINHFATVETTPLYAWKYKETGEDPEVLNGICSNMLFNLI